MSATTPYPPEVDAHIWRAYRKIRGRIKIGIALPRKDRAPLWAARLLNLLFAETAVKLDAVYELDGYPATSSKTSFLKTMLTRDSRDNPFQELRIATRPACCFIEVEYDSTNGLTDEARSTIAERNLDIWVWLHHRPLVGRAAEIARLGAWSFRFEKTSIELLQSKTEFSRPEALAGYRALEPSAALGEMAGPILIRKFLDELSIDNEEPSFGACAIDCSPVPDATPVHWGGKWYLIATSGGQTPETFLFYSSAPDGDWRYHPANPICADAARGLSDGNLFVADGKLIRPSQSSIGNGGPVVLWNEVTRLTPGEYQEQSITDLKVFADRRPAAHPAPE